MLYPILRVLHDLGEFVEHAHSKPSFLAIFASCVTYNHGFHVAYDAVSTEILISVKLLSIFAAFISSRIYSTGEGIQ